MHHKSVFTRVTLYSLVLILSACGTLQHDGPPRWRTDVSRIPDAIPRPEPLSKSGNRPVYRVNGVTYHVRSTSRNYREKGIASWYGTKFHSQPTSSGEIYDMLGMTAAHKSLPLPTYAKVTNLNNHKSVIVKINDRGPFAPGRIIDLSWAAAKKLGMTGHGTAWVEVAAIDPKEWQAGLKNISPEKIAPVLTVTTAGRQHSSNNGQKNVFLQAGTFRSRNLAEQLKKRINRYIDNPVRITRLNSFFRVEIGPLKNTLTATRIRDRLKLAGVDNGSIIRATEA